PCSFRHPVMTARMATAVDELSGGRLVLGMGAGWQEREHSNYGFDLLSMAERMQRFDESLQIVTRLFASDEPLTFAGRFYRLRDSVLLPRPRPGGPPILVGGNGPRRTLPLAARYAVEWNATFQSPASFQRLTSRLDALLRREERDPRAVRRSMMTGIVFGRSTAEVDDRLARRGRSAEDLRSRGVLVGTGEMVVEKLGELAAVGLQRVMLQWLDLDDLSGLEGLARSVLGRV
ncbi:MAG TPA: LLM class flavin-dependent oxidoreductase, partial [bacterium]|nr:LLM class flavin-dependent oxidoreductase [bacterium]